jgi:DNA-directed RNA polymerase specialized sigma24 family protein
VCSIGGELRAFEGLVHTTARMFAAQVRREEEDLAQELRVRVWRAIVTYDATKSPLSLERYVFQAVTNKIKDFKRDAVREARRREDSGTTLLHIEDIRVRHNETAQEVFDGYFHYVSHDEVYGDIDEGSFELPATITASEAAVLVLLMMGLSKRQAAERLVVARGEVERSVGALRIKLADWRPTDSSRVIEHAPATA